jgi:hypothetical protein
LQRHSLRAAYLADQRVLASRRFGPAGLRGCFRVHRMDSETAPEMGVDALPFDFFTNSLLLFTLHSLTHNGTVSASLEKLRIAPEG